MEYKIDFCNQDENCRYTLGTNGKNPLIWIGINPSTASSSNPDPTTKKIISLTNFYNYDSFILINLYPQRNSSPYNLINFSDEFHSHNKGVIFNYLNIVNNQSKKLNIVAIWGDFIDYCSDVAKYFIDINKMLSNFSINWYCLKNQKFDSVLTNLGNPRHPRSIYGIITETASLKNFNLTEYYIKKLKK